VLEATETQVTRARLRRVGHSAELQAGDAPAAPEQQGVLTPGPHEPGRG
jgi:hypothetical protein